MACLIVDLDEEHASILGIDILDTTTNIRGQFSHLHMRLPDELVGNWIVGPDGRVTRDEAEQQIWAAVHNRLKKIGVRDGGWTTLYQDSVDKTLLELSFPQGEMQGGGPARLTRVGIEHVQEFYPDVDVP